MSCSETRRQHGVGTRKVAWCTFLFLLVFAHQAPCRERVTTSVVLDEMFDLRKPIWEMSLEEFMAKYESKGFRWESADRQVARVANMRVTIFGLPIWETRILFRQNRPTWVTFSLYNRGDAGDLDKGRFRDLLAKAKGAVDQWAKTMAKPMDEPFNTRGVKRQSLLWTTPMGQAWLTWSFSTKDVDGHLAYRSEYIRLEMAPTSSSTASLNAANKPACQNGVRSTDTMTPVPLKERVKKDLVGDVWIVGVPMIDQGQKGYCAAAATVRVMRYYGIQIDQHEIAQIVSSSAVEGTNPSVMIDALKRVSTKLGCKIKVLDELDVEPFTKLITQYNQLAKRNRKPIISLGSSIAVPEVYDSMELDLLKEVRLKREGDYKRFQARIGQYINEGIPLFWSVITGKVSETPPVETVGGHLRLIIGYNAKCDEVLYSDTWGAGHELKRMKMDDAWAITHGLFVIEPRRMTL